MTIISYWKNLTSIKKTIIVIYIISFLVATCTHIFDIISNGFMPYDKFPTYLNIYWTCLTFLDPISIILLLINLHAGLVLYFIVILSDVIINASTTIIFKEYKELFNIFFMCQLSFLIFFLISFKMIWSVKNR